ncbi:MAG: hypothetical protein QM619_08770 [Micropruina sp.]|uniref:hypothetical protein n=1 Tax=Micropruina sp. TaxID=2737536 RepID=UPI0039E24B02
MVVQSVRQEARRRVREAAAVRLRSLAERESRLNDLAVDVVTAVAARDRADVSAAEAVGLLLGEQVSVAEIGERCGLSVKEVARLKRVHLKAGARGASDEPLGDASASDGGDQP